MRPVETEKKKKKKIRAGRVSRLRGTTIIMTTEANIHAYILRAKHGAKRMSLLNRFNSPGGLYLIFTTEEIERPET